MLYNPIIHINHCVDLNCVSTYSQKSQLTVFSNTIKETLHARNQIADMLRLGQDKVVIDIVKKIYLKNKKYIDIANENSMDAKKVIKLANLIKKAIVTSFLYHATKGHKVYSLTEQKDSTWNLGIDIQISSLLETLILIDRIKKNLSFY